MSMSTLEDILVCVHCTEEYLLDKMLLLVDLILDLASEVNRIGNDSTQTWTVMEG